ncbi:DUF3524 domain-containing protein [Thermodesulfobacteriota bacterium]
MTDNMKVLVLEPYYGGSHKAFLDGLAIHLSADLDLFTLPARKWKWRMRLAAPYFAERLRDRSGEYTSILCSTFVDVATLKALAPAWIHDVPLITYFHKNQFAYPVQVEDERDFHFALTNFTTALASDRIVFNSRYNQETFFTGCRDFIRRSHDMKVDYGLGAIGRKAIILSPGIDFSAIDQAPDRKEESKYPVIVWNHRWEHDKNPGLFFEALYELDRKGFDFSVLLLGKSFQRQPVIFEKARERLAHRLIHYGYVKSRREYGKWLKKGDIIASTATHEFFGISVLEAVRAGCRPLLPNRLSYPEIFPKDFLYDDENFITRLIDILGRKRLSKEYSKELTEKYSWKSLAGEYSTLLTETKKNTPNPV